MTDINIDFWEQIKKAATESNWIPAEYYMNDWVADVCDFLRTRCDGTVPPKEKKEEEEKKVGQRKEEEEKKETICSVVMKDKEKDPLSFITKSGTRSAGKKIIKKARQEEQSPAPKKNKPIFSNTPVRRPKKVRFTPAMEEVFQFWVEKGFTSHREGTMVHYEAVEKLDGLFRGTLFYDLVDRSWRDRQFSVEEIKKAIANFELAAFHEKYRPDLRRKLYLRKMSLGTFLFNSHVVEDKYKSQFLIHLNPPQLVSDDMSFRAMKDDYPHCTKILVDWFLKEFPKKKELDVRERNAMIMVSRRLKEFLDNNKNLLQIEDFLRLYNQYVPLNFLAIQLTRCAEKMLREKEDMRLVFKPSWFVSDIMLRERFPSFLKSEHMMK